MSFQSFTLQSARQIPVLTAYLEAAVKTRPLRVTVTDRPSRTSSQLAYLHLAIRQLADHVGMGESELKEHFKLEYGPKTVVRLANRDVVVPKSTTDYTIAEASQMIEHVVRTAAECGLLLAPEPQW